MFADTRRYLGCGHPGELTQKKHRSVQQISRVTDIHVEKKDIHTVDGSEILLTS